MHLSGQSLPHSTQLDSSTLVPSRQVGGGEGEVANATLFSV